MINRSAWHCSKPVTLSELTCCIYRLGADLEEVLRNSDYIVNLLPSTPETRNLLSGDVLQVCSEKVQLAISPCRFQKYKL